MTVPTASLTRALRRVVAATSLAVLGVTTAGVAAPWPAASAAPRPVPATRDVERPEAAPLARLGGDLPAGTTRGRIMPATEVATGLAVVGATWEDGAVSADDDVQVRVQRDGAWQDWESIPRDDDHGPDSDSAEGRQAAGRAGTQPYVVVGDATQVRVVTSGAVAPAVDVDVIDPGTSPADQSVGTAPSGSASAATARPTIHTRAEWGADESLRGDPPEYGQVQVGFVHHTAGSNSYTAAQVPSILRGIYAFHVKDRGWNDIGYQFLVDKFGRVWEGRYGGVDKAVVGAQVGGYNSGSFGASVLGDFTSTSPSSASVTAIEQLFAWKFSLHGIPARGTVEVTDQYFDRISGHRDAGGSTCPGQKLYDQLGTIRSSVASRLGTQAPTTVRRSVDAGGTPDVLSYPGDLRPPVVAGAGEVLTSAPTQPVASARRIGTGWNVLRDIVVSPDLTGDGHPDLLAIDPSARNVRVYSGDGRGGVTGMTVRGGGWHVMSALIATGDRTGDRKADLLAVRGDGALVLYTGDGYGWVTTGTVIATGFGATDSVASAGDVTRDGRLDLLRIRRSDGRLLLYPGVAGGGVGAPVVWGAGWQSLDQLSAGPDLDRDGRVGDVTARQADGRMRTYYADETGRLTRMNTWGKGWGSMDDTTSGTDWTGDGVADVVARATSTGELRVYPGTGRRDFSAAPLPLRTDVSGADLFRLVGDVDGDGLADAVARVPGGDLIGLQGRGDGSFGRLPARIGAGWQVFDLIEPVGDLTRDGVPDLVARVASTGDLRIYPMTRSFGFPWVLSNGSDWRGALSVTGVGAVNADANGDVVALRTDGSVRLYRGSGPGVLNWYDTVLTGQTDLAQVLGVGDFTGDGPADLLARGKDGRVWVYSGDGRSGFSTSRQPVRAPSEVNDVIG